MVRINFVKKFFNKFRKFIFTTKGIMISSFSLFFIVLFFLILSIYGPCWKIWPPNIRANIALNRLALSIYREPYCRTECYFKRLTYQAEILSFSDNEKYFSKISRIIFADTENIAWRLELLKIVSYKKDWPPAFFEKMQTYLDDDSNNLEFKKHLLFYFNNYLDLDNYINDLMEIISDISRPYQERALAINNLATLNLFDFAVYLKSFLEEENDDLIIEILKIMGGNISRFSIEEEILFNFLDNILRSPNSSFTSRRLALFILADFLSAETDNSANILLEKIISAGELDKFSRYLAIDISNNYLSEKRESPYISSSDWSWYYTQK